MTERLRLGVNIDHVATIRNARGGDHPDPVRAAQIVASVGGGASLEVMEVGGRAATVLRVGATDGVSVEVTLPGRP